MYIIRMYYVFLVHMYIAMCSDDRSGHKAYHSTRAVEAQGPSQYTPQSAKLIGHEVSLSIFPFYHGPLVASWLKDIWLI